jgi:hypothetical protein
VASVWLVSGSIVAFLWLFVAAWLRGWRVGGVFMACFWVFFGVRLKVL